MTWKRTSLFLLALTLTVGLRMTASSQTVCVPSYTVTVGPCTIGNGESVSYTTISSQFSGQQLPDGMYPGELTLELTGPVVVEQGGSLSIGTLSIGNDQEASPVIQGTLSQQPLIVVKSGGSLTLTNVIANTTGEGLLILQEPGASVSITASQIASDLVQWAPATVINLYDKPDDIWLEEGVPLTEALLPSTLMSNLQEQGQEERMELDLAWDFTGYDGRTTGSLTLTGSFVDQQGRPLLSMLPLTVTVHWYQPEQLVVTDVIWKGETACSIHFILYQPPEHTQFTGEYSTDGGKTWQTWSNFDTNTTSDGAMVCNFYEVDTIQKHYRVVASDLWSPSFWASESFLLPQKAGDDSEGNRGGSTTPVTPQREPTPPDASAPPLPTPQPVEQDGGTSELDVVLTPEPESTTTPTSTPAPTAPATLSPTTAPTAAPQTSVPPTNGVQIGLIVGGIALCAGFGLWIAGKKS